MLSRAPISVVITVYNDWQYLEQAIESIFNQKLLPSEIIVVDDGSDQSDAQVITEGYINNLSSVNVSFYKKDNGGASSARNYGIQKSKEQFIAFLDVDDAMLPNNLLEKYKLINHLDDQYFGVYGGALRSIGEAEIFPNFDGIANPDLLDVQYQGIPGGSPFFLFNKAALIEINGFDESLKCNEDYDLIIRLIKLDKKCLGSTGEGFYRNIRSDSLSRPNDPKLLFERVMLFLDKAEHLNYYSKEHLNQRKMAIHTTYVKGLLFNRELFNALSYARKGFSYSKPYTLKQKLLYYFTFSFL